MTVEKNTTKGLGQMIEAITGYHEENLKHFAGKTITGVWHKDGDVAFTFDDGSAIYADPEGDCCSHSWVEHVSGVADAIGAVVEKVDCAPELATQENVDDGDHECLALYGISLITTRGHRIDIDYRNSSNGYYGGWLNWNYEEDCPGSDWTPIREDF